MVKLIALLFAWPAGYQLGYRYGSRRQIRELRDSRVKHVVRLDR